MVGVGVVWGVEDVWWLFGGGWYTVNPVDVVVGSCFQGEEG